MLNILFFTPHGWEFWALIVLALVFVWLSDKFGGNRTFKWVIPRFLVISAFSFLIPGFWIFLLTLVVVIYMIIKDGFFGSRQAE